MIRFARLILVVAHLTCITSMVGADDWPQAAANPQRTAHVTDQPNPPYEVAWVKGWHREVLRNTCQPIIVDGTVYVGTVSGNVHAVEAASGEDLWTARVGPPICHALACDGSRVIAAAMDGSIYAFDRRQGAPVWQADLSRRGFCAAPLLLGGRVFVGNRDGFCYAVAADTGELGWKTDTGDPIVQTAAGAGDRIVLVNEGMRAFCFSAGSGEVLWKTDPLPGRTVRDYWPVIHQGRVVIRTAEAGARILSGRVGLLQKRLFWPVSYNAADLVNQNVHFKATSVDDILQEQDLFVAFYQQYPMVRTFLVLNLSNGTEPYTASVVTGCRNTGVPPPPVVAGNANLYTTFRTSAAFRGLIDITDCGLGRFDLDSGKIARPLVCGQADVGKVIGARSPFELTSDETVTMSSGGNLIFGFRCDAAGGAIDVNTRRRAALPDVELPKSSDMLPSGNVLAVSRQWIVYTKFDHVICIRGHR